MKEELNRDFSNHIGYSRMFAENKLTIGIFLPLRFYEGNMNALEGQSDLVSLIDQHNFAAVWTRDVPLFDHSFGDAGQVFDTFSYLAYLAAKTKQITLATGSLIFPLRHPVDLAKAATTIDQLSGGRLVLGVASGDRPVEYPAYGIDINTSGERFRETVSMFRSLISSKENQIIQSTLGLIKQSAQLLPKPVNNMIPLLVTGSSKQSMDWIGEHADGWLSYPTPTATTEGVMQLKSKIENWRSKIIPHGMFRPHVTNEWIDLVDDPDFPRTPLRGGFILKTGRKGLIQLLEEWQSIGVNHAALGIQFTKRPALETIQELAEEVLPLFPTHKGTKSVPLQY